MHTAVVQLHKQQPMRIVPHAKAANSSFDAEDDLDTDLAEELSRFRTPDTWNKVAEHLDLVWKIGRVSASSAVCSGLGLLTAAFMQPWLSTSWSHLLLF